MSIGAVNNVSFQGEQKKRHYAMPILLGAAGGISGYATGSPIKAEQVATQQDEFKLSEKATEKATPKEKEAVTKINELRNGLKDEAIEKEAKANIEKIFKGKEDITVEELLGKDSKTFEEELTKANENTKGLTDAKADAQTKYNEATDKLKTATDETKVELEKAEKNAKKVLDEATEKLAKHTEEVAEKQKNLDLAKTAKENKIKATEALTKEKEVLKTKHTNKIGELVKEIGHDKLPKVKNLGKTALWAAIGIVAGVILNKIFFRKPKEEAVQA